MSRWSCMPEDSADFTTEIITALNKKPPSAPKSRRQTTAAAPATSPAKPAAARPSHSKKP